MLSWRSTNECHGLFSGSWVSTASEHQPLLVNKQGLRECGLVAENAGAGATGAWGQFQKPPCVAGGRLHVLIFSSEDGIRATPALQHFPAR